MRKSIVAALVAITLPLAAMAQEYATTKDAEMMVHRAVSFLKKEGKEKAFAAFSDTAGQFRYRDLYVMAYDMEGRCLAHGAKKERIGKLLIDEKDADGKAFVRERIAIAKRAGKGWQEYKFQNPVSKKIEDKVVYIEVVDGVIVVSGAYKAK
jgi:signal transduction histidine kinase